MSAPHRRRTARSAAQHISDLQFYSFFDWELTRIVVTHPDGVLVGVLRREDLE